LRTVPRYWTVEEANRELPDVAAAVDRLQRLAGRLSEPDAIEGFARAKAESGGGWPGRDVALCWMALELGMHVLQARGVVVRDLGRGLIDFPSMRDGREVYLCWLSGEDEVSHWHEPDAGFAGRRPV
jgi:hypothetical protein